MQAYNYLKEVVFQSFNGLTLKAFWLLVECKFFVMYCICTIFHSAANHNIILVRKLLGIYFLDSGYIYITEREYFPTF